MSEKSTNNTNTTHTPPQDNPPKEVEKNEEKNDEEDSNTFRRIKIMDLPREITRGHIEELCGKYGKINEIEMRRGNNGMNSFVTFHKVVDAEFALYRLLDSTYMGSKIKAYPAKLTKEEIEQRKNEAKERERKRLEGKNKKKKIIKLPKGSLRHLAPRNAPTTGNIQRNNQQGNTQKGNQQETKNQKQNQGRKKQNQGGNNVQGNRNGGGQRQNQGGNQPKSRGGYQLQGQRNRNGQGNRNQGQRQYQGNDQNRNKGKYRVKYQQNTNDTEEQPKEEQKIDETEPIYEVTVRNINTDKQLFNIMFTEEELNQYFPPEDRSKLLSSEEE